jgi:hypothetical protein
MFASSLVLLTLASIPVVAQSNPPTLVGTWSSGSQHVITGSTFVNPANLSFSYPATTGMSYSFSSDGYYEIARYRMYGNGSAPQCITGVMNFVHGRVQQNSNGSLTLYPFGDGFQQIQAPCAPTSNFIETYNDTELYQSWLVYADPVLGTTLQLAQFDQSLLPPLYLISTTPNMLPTQALRNVSSSSNISKRSTNDAPPTSRWATASLIAVGGLLGSALLVLA